MAIQDLGRNVVGEYQRFRNVLTNLPDRPGHGRYVEVHGSGSLQGFASAEPEKEDGWFVNLPSMQVNYESKSLDQEHPEDRVLIRSLMYQQHDDSNPAMWKLETWHRDTKVLERDGTVLSDEARHATAVYPGKGNARNGIIVSDEPIPELPLTSAQQGELCLWQIAH
ncbi:MAG: hypothetical protein HY319_23305 [Armatimonadetes bacterium]|nr:hypothetical protein [Armatimonadota bacterium]